MSKKIAAGAQRILLDVKVGLGAFMKDLESARELARTMVWIGRQIDREVVAMISDMNQPLGSAVGNVLEVREAIETLKGGGPQDFRQHCLDAAAQMLMLGELAVDVQEGTKMAQSVIANGQAFQRFKDLVGAQGGDTAYIDHPEKLANAAYKEFIVSERDGYLSQMNALSVGEASVLLGAGRRVKGEAIDHAVGIIVHHKVGDQISAGEPLLTLYANQKPALKDARKRLEEAIEISRLPVKQLPLFYDVIRWDDLQEGA